MLSNHLARERQSRLQVAAQIGFGYTVKCAILDRGHARGAEVHEITSTGLIVIRNAKTDTVVTILIARPGQIRRYWEDENDIPESLMEQVLKNFYRGYNEI